MASDPDSEPEPEPDSIPAENPAGHWLRVAATLHGRGVLAIRPIPADTLIERSHVILVPRSEIGPGVLSHYVFEWPDPAAGDAADADAPGAGAMFALPGGMGMLFNHSRNANVAFQTEPATLTIAFRTTRAIERGEELLIDYDYDAEHLAILRHPEWYVATPAQRGDSGAADQPLSP